MYYSEAQDASVICFSMNLGGDNKNIVHVKYNNDIEGDLIFNLTEFNNHSSHLLSREGTTEIYVTNLGRIFLKFNDREIDFCPDVVYYYIAKTGKFDPSYQDGDFVIFRNYDFERYCDWNMPLPNIVNISSKSDDEERNYMEIQYENDIHGILIINEDIGVPYLEGQSIYLKGVKLNVDYQRMYYDIATTEQCYIQF